MDIKRLGINVGLSYTLSDEDLSKNAEWSRLIYQQACLHNVCDEDFMHVNRAVTVSDNGQSEIHIHGSATVRKVLMNNYLTSITYDPPVKLSKKLLEFELGIQKMDLADLRRDETRNNFLLVEPAGPSIFNGFWSAHRSSRVVTTGDEVNPSFVFRAIFHGLPNKEAIAEFEALGGTLYLPKQSDNGYTWTTEDENASCSGGTPEVRIVKKFDGEITTQSEGLLIEMYEGIKNVLLRHKQIRYCPAEDAETEARLDGHISKATLVDQTSWVAPCGIITAVIPIGEPYEGDRYSFVDKQMRRVKLIDTIELRAPCNRAN
ncbi:MAG: hypothetical protein HY226_06645 [Candidatus Vogelbacteria bacterium]|nr:hypothetical protein [Candidatus Vogelbacteria bacterium]